MKKRTFRVLCEEWNGYLFKAGKTYIVENDRIKNEKGTEFSFSKNVNINGKFRELPLTKLEKALK